MNSARPSIAVAMTCFNRRKKTVACVASLQAAMRAIEARYGYRLYLTDDGSTDGTADAVRAIEPEAEILQGSGSLYWGGGMHAALDAAMTNGHDFYLWLNDDVTLLPDGLAQLMAAWEGAADPATIVVGSMKDEDGRLSYGGVRRPRAAKRITFALVPPAATPQPAESFNGNCVLVPAAAAARLGNIDARFIHTIGDFDYGLRATAAGVPILVATGYAGVCGKNDPAGSFNDRALPMRERLRKLSSSKGLPIDGWREFCRRHTGPAWPLFAIWPYARVVATSLLPRR